jgi:hypothetical protein
MRPGFGPKIAYSAMSFFDEVSNTGRCGRMQTLRYDMARIGMPGVA